VLAMDDKELIKRIMEEVKDEKLREELLRRVAKGEGNGVNIEKEKLEKMMEELKDLKYTGKIAKVEWYSMWLGWVVFGIIVGLPIVVGIVGVILFILSDISGLSPMSILGMLLVVLSAIFILSFKDKPVENQQK
jgi:membrane-bound ClpP family serine protease